jgi:acyl CoA:acetate/3-ketoacid CoA transferase beta subunit
MDYPITPDDIMVACMARRVQNGEIVAQGIATPLVAAAYLLARLTHAPQLYFASAIGQGVCRDPAPISLVNIERLWLDRSLMNLGFVRVAADALPLLRPKEFFRPGQVDPQGNFNNIAFGANYHKPLLRLPGTGGIPDVTTYIHDIHMYVPRHSRLIFVPKLDFLSGLGHHPDRKYGAGPAYLVSDLGEFDFHNGRLRLTSYHPGVEIKRIQAKTGFELEIAPEIHETVLPTNEEIRLLYEEIDPLGIRRLEGMSGASRRQLLREIISIEARELNESSSKFVAE